MEKKLASVSRVSIVRLQLALPVLGLNAAYVCLASDLRMKQGTAIHRCQQLSL